jgi:hypothetical protein
MEAEVAMLRDVYKSAVRKNLAQEHFWNSQSARYGFGPAVLDPELLELRTLTDPHVSDEEENIPDDRKNCLLVFFNFNFNSQKNTFYKLVFDMSGGGGPWKHF